MNKTIDLLIEEMVEELNNKNFSIEEQLLDTKELASCNFISRTSGILYGIDIAGLIFKKVNSKIVYKIMKPNGSYVNRGDVLAVINGPVFSILKAEKLALSLLRYLSGIASLTDKYNLELEGTSSTLLYSGFSMPTIDELVKNAFITGNGKLQEEKNYQVLSLNVLTRYDSIDNAIIGVKNIDKNSKILVEVNNLNDFESAYLSSATAIRIISNKINLLEECSAINKEQKVLEVEGEFDVKKVRSIAKMGYKYIIIPSITESAQYLPIDMCFYKRLYKKN